MHIINTYLYILVDELLMKIKTRNINILRAHFLL